MLLKDLLALREPLKNLCSKHLISFKTARLLSKAFKKVEEEAEVYSKEQLKLFDIYVKKDAKGNYVQGTQGGLELKEPSDKQKYEEDLKKILESDIGEIAIIKISETEFTNPSDFPTPQDMIMLEKIIDWDSSDASEVKN